ncbi:MAG TPA: hypothetical protein PLY49_11710 [Opitutaceae bacterium]|nr:hypothetical protein [Opitutaceae bacterium]
MPLINSSGSRGLLLLIGLCLGGGLARAEFMDFLLPESEIDILTVTDFTEDGRALRPVSKANPMYYEALILGHQDLGRPLAGNPEPDKKAMVKLIMKILADQGYYPCNSRKNHPPEILLAFGWGTINRAPGMSALFMGAEKLNLMWELVPEIPGKIDPRRLFNGALRSPLADHVMSISHDELYILTIQAFDEAAAMQGKTKRLWHTKVSCPARGLNIIPTLNEMVRIAGPNIGKETATPIRITRHPKEAVVTIGELKVLEMIDLNAMPITDIDDPIPAPAPATPAPAVQP